MGEQRGTGSIKRHSYFYNVKTNYVVDVTKGLPSSTVHNGSLTIKEFLKKMERAKRYTAVRIQTSVPNLTGNRQKL